MEKKKAVQERFAQYAAMEPALLDIEREIKAIRAKAKDEDEFCANHAWFQGGMKSRMSALVGWYRDHGPEPLQEVEAYDVCYDHLYKLMPDCKNCRCL